MDERERVEFLTAFLVGGLIGAGAALLLKPAPKTRTDRILDDLKPYRKRIRKGAHRARKSAGRSASAAADLGEDLVDTGRDAISDLRDEIGSIVASAREEIASAVEDRIRTGATKRLRRGAKRIGLG